MVSSAFTHRAKRLSFIKEMLLFGSLFFAATGVPLLSHAEPKYDEGHVRAVVLFRIMRFIEWDELTGGTLNLCAFGKGNSLDHLEILNGKPIPNLAGNTSSHNTAKVGGRSKTLILKTLKKEQTDTTNECHIMLIGELESPFAIEPPTTKGSHLVVCDGCSYTDTRASVELVTIDKKTRFNVDLNAAKRSQIRISSDLLVLANKVRGIN